MRAITRRLSAMDILAQHPLILGTFSGAGGKFLLYRPGSPPIEAPPVPISCQILKSVGRRCRSVRTNGRR